LPVKKLEQVVYFASYIITDVFQDKRTEALRDLEDRFKVTKAEMQKEIQKEVNELRLQKEGKEINVKKFALDEAIIMKKLDDLVADYENLRDVLKSLEV
jgi:hypothetical protein